VAWRRRGQILRGYRAACCKRPPPVEVGLGTLEITACAGNLGITCCNLSRHQRRDLCRRGFNICIIGRHIVRFDQRPVGAISECAECQDGAEDRKKALTSRCCIWYRCVSLEGVIDRPPTRKSRLRRRLQRTSFSGRTRSSCQPRARLAREGHRDSSNR